MRILGNNNKIFFIKKYSYTNIDYRDIIFKLKFFLFITDLKAIFRNSRDSDELTHIWKSWRDATGKKMRNQFEKVVKLKNEAAKLDGMWN